MKPVGADEPWHGTLNGYGNHRCRCADCSEAKRVSNREYRRRPEVRARRQALRARIKADPGKAAEERARQSANKRRQRAARSPEQVAADRERQNAYMRGYRRRPENRERAVANRQ